MASAVVGALRIDLAMNAGEFSRGARQARQEMNSLAGAIGQISSSMNRASILINTGILAAQRFAGAASGIFNVASAFEKGMANVSTLVDTSNESLKQMSQEVLEIAKRTPVALADLTSGLYDIRSAGIPAADALKVLEGSARLAVAGLGSTKEAADLVTSSINAFGLSGEEAADVYDQIFKTIKAGKTTISGLAQGFGAVAGTISNAGIKLDDYLSSIAAMTVTGVQAAQAHTQIRAAVAGLLRETTETKALFDALNVKTFKELVAQSGSVVTAFQRIVRATQNNDGMLLKLLGSSEAYQAVITLAGKQNEAFTKTLNSMRDGTAEVGKAFEKQNATLDAALIRLRNNLEAVATSIGSTLAPTINAIATKVASLAAAFTALSPETQELIAHIIAIAGVVVPATIALGFFANALASLIPVFSGIGIAIGILSTGLMTLLGPAGPFVLFVTASWTILAAWKTFETEIKSIFDRVAAYLSSKVADMVKDLTYLKDVVLNAVGQMSDQDFFNKWATAAEGVGTAIRGMAGQARDLGAAAGEMKSAWVNAFEPSDGIVQFKEELTELEKLWKKHNDEALRFGLQVVKDINDPTERLIAQQIRLKDALDAGGLTAEQYGRAMAKAAMVSTNAYAGMASEIANNLSQAFGESKAFAIAAAIINTAESITKTLATYGATPWGIALAASAAAAGAAQIAAIRKTTKSGGGGGGGGGGSAVAGASGPTSIPQAMTVNIHGQTFGREQVFGLIDQINEAGKDGKHVIVRAA
jgi:TP901 family phage tail tape measure protein